MKIRGTEYAIANTSDTALIPMLTCLGAAGMAEDMSKEAIAETIMQRLSDPSNHRRLAYSLKAALPGLPKELVRYETYLLPDGREQIEFAFGLNAQELVDAIAAIMAAREDAPLLKPVATPALTERELKLQYLRQELALLGEE